MFILDTNVVSELMRPFPEQAVLRWLQGQTLDQLAVTAVTVAEILYGLDRLPKGRRRTDLSHQFQLFLARGFTDRVLPFDERAARAYAELKGTRDRAGRPIAGYDAMIAAIAQVHGAEVATRNVKDFEGCSVAVLDPWRG
jgi:hypothetical protein